MPFRGALRPQPPFYMGCGKVKTGKLIGAVVVLFLAMATFSVMAGCIGDNAPKVQGSIHNNRDEKSVVNVFRQDGSLSAQNAVDANSVEKWELFPGRYTINAQGNDGVEFGDTDVTIAPTDTFTIIVYEDTISVISG